MNILDKIVEHKRQEIKERRELYPIKLLEKSIFFDSKTVSLSHYIKREDKSGIIAEIKRKSPSKQAINPYVNVERTAIGYMQAGASALSVLTDKHFFGGSTEDLKTARKFNYCPILRKDFILDEYQIIEAKSIGADAILLIAACLTKDEVKHLATVAKSLGLEVLLEIHQETELKVLTDAIDIVGVNNRNLDTFKTDIQTSLDLIDSIPSDFVKISESGISNPATILRLKNAGFQGFLIGEHFMLDSHPEKACALFIDNVNRLEQEQQDSLLLA